MGAVITLIKSVCATYGIPEVLISHEASPFKYDLMRNFFFQEWNIKYHITSLHFPEVNGQIV